MICSTISMSWRNEFVSIEAGINYLRGLDGAAAINPHELSGGGYGPRPFLPHAIGAMNAPGIWAHYPVWASIPPIFKVVIVFSLLLLLFSLGRLVVHLMTAKETEKHISGARVVESHELRRAVVEKETQSQNQSPLMIGDVPWPRKLEGTHMLVVGTTGVGKSTLMGQLLRGVKQRGARALVVDLNGEYAAKLRRPMDRIFNPLDPASIKWNPLCEIECVSDIDQIIRSGIPISPSAEEESWRVYARQFLCTLMKRLYETGDLTMERLKYYVLSAGDKELQAYLQEGADGLRMQQNSMTSTVKTLAQNFVTSIDRCDLEADFSIRKWVQCGDGCIYLTPRDIEMSALSGLINTFLNIAIVEALSAPPDRRYKPIALFLDELDSFDLSELGGVLAKGRKFNLTAFAGIQNIAQLRKKYGRDGATILLSCFRTKVIFNPGDAETAAFMAQELGEQVIERQVVSESVGENYTSTTTSWHREPKKAVSPVDLEQLPDLQAFVKLGGVYPVVKITIPA